MPFAQYLPSALSKAATRSLLCYEGVLSSRVSNVARVSLSLSNVLLMVAVVSAQRCCREWVSFSAQFWTYGVRIFLLFAVFILCGCRVDSRSCC